MRVSGQAGRALLTASFLAAALYACSGLLQKSVNLPVIEGATDVGSAVCADCHEGIAEGFEGQAHRLMATAENACEACHGAGSAHVDSVDAADIRGSDVLRALTPTQKSQICLGCHALDIAHYSTSAHAEAGLSCWSCHSDALHTAGSVKGYADSGWGTIEPISLHRVRSLSQSQPDGGDSKFCYQCHADVRADFLLQYHHPVPEGRMECSSCHAPHGDNPGRFSEASQPCLSCHRDIAGPYVFEHLALDDGCVPCHAPHGSTVDKMLLQADNTLCQQCHFDAQYPLIGGVDHTRLLSGGALCLDCHFQVHGSNTDENLNPLRIEETLRSPRLR